MCGPFFTLWVAIDTKKINKTITHNLHLTRFWRWSGGAIFQWKNLEVNISDFKGFLQGRMLQWISNRSHQFFCCKKICYLRINLCHLSVLHLNLYFFGPRFWPDIWHNYNCTCKTAFTHVICARHRAKQSELIVMSCVPH